MLVKENYTKFLDVAQNSGYMEGEKPINFSLEGLAKCIDIAFLEGQLSVLMKTPNFEENKDIMADIESIQKKLEGLVPSEFEEAMVESETLENKEEVKQEKEVDEEEEVVVVNV